MDQDGSCLSQSLEDVGRMLPLPSSVYFLTSPWGQDLHYGRVKQRNTSPPGWGLAF